MGMYATAFSFQVRILFTNSKKNGKLSALRGAIETVGELLRTANE
jgi:hypothetical protein